MDEKRLIADIFCRYASDAIGERVTVELADGAGKGVGLRGCVAWDGTGWRIMMDRNVSDWQMWKNLWHELAHVHYGDTPRTGAGETLDAERLLIEYGPSAMPSAWDRYTKNPDHSAEKRADNFALAYAREYLDELNLDLALATARAKAAELRGDATVKAINRRYGVDMSAHRDAGTKLVQFLPSVPAVKALDLETEEQIRKTIERLRRLFPDSAKDGEMIKWIRSVLTRRARYLKWVDELLKSGEFSYAT